MGDLDIVLQMYYNGEIIISIGTEKLPVHVDVDSGKSYLPECIYLAFGGDPEVTWDNGEKTIEVLVELPSCGHQQIYEQPFVVKPDGNNSPGMCVLGADFVYNNLNQFLNVVQDQEHKG